MKMMRFNAGVYVKKGGDKTIALTTEAAVTAFLCPNCPRVHVNLEFECTPMMQFSLQLTPEQAEEFARELQFPDAAQPEDLGLAHKE